MSTDWFVYILRCQDGSLYTGITTDIKRRVKEHKAGEGSSYTAARGVKELVYKEGVEDRSVASQREAEIKQLTKDQKEQIIA
jgi:putative endonuclease